MLLETPNTLGRLKFPVKTDVTKVMTVSRGVSWDYSICLLHIMSSWVSSTDTEKKKKEKKNQNAIAV